MRPPPHTPLSQQLIYAIYRAAIMQMTHVNEPLSVFM